MLFKKNTSPSPTIFLSLSRIHFIRVLESLSFSPEQINFKGSFSFRTIVETGAFNILGTSRKMRRQMLSSRQDNTSKASILGGWGKEVTRLLIFGLGDNI